MEELHRSLSKSIRDLLQRQLGPQDLDEEVSDAFLNIVQSVRKGKLPGAVRLMSFMQTIASWPAATRTDFSAHQLDPDSRVIRQQNQELAMRLLRSLDKRDREVLERFYVQEQTAEQISREMGLTPTQFRLIKTRAKARFVELGQRRFASRSGNSKDTKEAASDGSSGTVSEASSQDTQGPASDGTGGYTDDAVLAHAFDTFGSPEKANHWLHRPNHVFQGRTPLEAIGSDPEAVEIELTRIDHGVYI
jgi:RNA polymerase sigma-70 factor (ECF subfamily)